MSAAERGTEMYQAQIARQVYTKNTGAEQARCPWKHAKGRGTGREVLSGVIVGIVALLVALTLQGSALGNSAFQSLPVPVTTSKISPAVVTVPPRSVPMLVPLPAPTAGPTVTLIRAISCHLGTPTQRATAGSGTDS